MKSFSEVFPSLNYEGELNSIFEMSQVERITAPPDMSFVKIFIALPRLIDRETIHRMEALIKDRLFPKKEIRVEISERFILSEQYNPKNLYNSYKTSIFSDLKQRNILEYRILNHSDIGFTDDSKTAFF